jgi:hypothetical protein
MYLEQAKEIEEQLKKAEEERKAAEKKMLFYLLCI